MPDSKPLLLVMNASREFGRRVAEAAGEPLTAHEEREFEDGEHKVRPLGNVRNQHVFVIDSLYSSSSQSVNDKLCRLLFLLGALRDASAARVTAVVPYLCYARKDRKTKPRDPVTTRYVARLFEAVGTNHLVTIDVHNLAAFQNAFGTTTTDHLEAMGLFVDYFASLGSEDALAIVSPDVGGIKRAELFRTALETRTGRQVTHGFLQKQRSDGVVQTGALVGDVKGRTAIIVDDLISSGTTIENATRACHSAGAARVYAAATHGLLTSEAEAKLGRAELEKVVITNTVDPWRVSPDFVARRLHIIDVAPLFAAAINCIHNGGSVVDLAKWGTGGPRPSFLG